MPGVDAASASARAGRAADRDQQVEPACGGRAAALRVQPRRVRAELEHLAEHRDLARTAGRDRDGLERRVERGGLEL